MNLKSKAKLRRFPSHSKLSRLFLFNLSRQLSPQATNRPNRLKTCRMIRKFRNYLVVSMAWNVDIILRMSAK